jgi:hypothetical protein
MKRKGRARSLKGVASPNAKLTEEAVRDILQNCRTGDENFSPAVFARKYHVSDSVVAHVRKRRSWKHVQVDVIMRDSCNTKLTFEVAVQIAVRVLNGEKQRRIAGDIVKCCVSKTGASSFEILNN